MAKREGTEMENKSKKVKSNTFTDELSEMEPVATEAAKWQRNKLDVNRFQNENLSFQWIDINTYDGQPLSVNPKKGEKVVGSLSGKTPIIRMFGCTMEGYSVCMHVHGFTPYFYVNAPPGFKKQDCSKVRSALEGMMRERDRSSVKLGCYVQAVQLKEGLSSIYGYQFEKKKSVLVVYVSMPNLVASARSIFDTGINIQGYGMQNYGTYESNVPYILRFMIDNDISGCNWIELPKDAFKIRDKTKTSSCQIEVDIVYNNIISHPAEGPWGHVAPMRILSFDIECMGRKGHFPDASQDPVIQIANVVSLYGSDVPIIRNVFVLGTCKQIIGAHVMEFENEGLLLQHWAHFVRQVDPDVMTGYNTDNFDVPYLMNRGKALGLRNADIWGRLLNTPNSTEKKAFNSAQYGKSESIKTHVHGRAMFDLLPIMRRNHQLSSYSLNAVSAHFLGQQKEDVPHGIISDLQRGSEDDRHRLAVYCLKDAYLPMRILSKLSCLVNYVEMARVTGVPLDYLIDRGQQIKVFSMILRKCKKFDLIVPNFKRGENSDDAGYEGATVIEPKKAYYTVPIATLDFASLYPSIMQAYNLCFSTLVAPADVAKLKEGSYQVSPSGDTFVVAETKKGILPQILQELLSARKRAKADMKNATDPMEKAVQNGRQLALKVSANSVYGFTGANVGQLPCIPIASSVTAYGRQLLMKTQEEVEKIYTVENGYPGNADVVYGDTDSVMVRFGVQTVAEAMPLAMEAANRVSNIFPNPIKLEFEKVYFPYLLMNKKRYAGLYWTNTEKFDKLDSKGLETVRRDNCLLVRRMVSTCLHKILIDRDVQDALNYTKGIISDLLQNKTDLSMLVITKGLNKTGEGDDYKVKQGHIELSKRMRQRDPGSAPVLGERIAYVVVDKGKNIPMYQKSEDPVYALENNIPLDCDYYLNNQLQNPLERIFEPIIGEGKVKSELFAGDHTLKRKKPVIKLNSGGMMNFAVKKAKCLGCKSPLNGAEAVCKDCVENEASIYLEKLKAVNNLSNQYSRLWTQCQSCQGSLHQEVICTSKDCPIFYRRIKVHKELGEAEGTMERFTMASKDW